jgi:putative FmdB family regulatory protein
LPIYKFRCDKCVLEIEKIQGINEAIPKCDICGGDMTKIISSPAIIRVPRGKVIPRSKGYKEGYSREYLKDNPPSTEF